MNVRGHQRRVLIGPSKCGDSTIQMRTETGRGSCKTERVRRKDGGKLGQAGSTWQGRPFSAVQGEVWAWGGCFSIPALACLPESVVSSHHPWKWRKAAQLALPIPPAGSSGSANPWQRLRHTGESLTISYPVSKPFQHGRGWASVSRVLDFSEFLSCPSFLHSLDAVGRSWNRYPSTPSSLHLGFPKPPLDPFFRIINHCYSPPSELL